MSSGGADAQSFEPVIMRNIDYVDVIDVSELGDRSRVIAMFRLEKGFSNKRLAMYEQGKTEEGIYRACARVALDDVDCSLECYVKIPAVQLNAVGDVVADVGYAAALVANHCYRRDARLRVHALELQEEVLQLPDWQVR